MAKTYRLCVVSDADWIGFRADLSEEEFDRFLEDPEEFEDERVRFIEYGNFRNTTVEDEYGDSVELGDSIYDNNFDPSDEDSYYDEEKDSDDPVRKELCEELKISVESQYNWINELAPNSVTILEKWHTYKEMDYYELELEDDEEFDEEKLQFVIDSFIPNWLREYGKRTGDCLDDIFVEDRIEDMELIYNGKIIYLSDSEDLGADLVVRYAIRTDEKGNVVSVEKLDTD